MIIALLAGCSATGSPTAATVSVPSVDVSALDTGTYPTSPRPQFGKATEDDIIAVEGQRLAQFVLAPFEVDRDLTVVQSPTGIIKNPAGVSMVINQKSSTVLANKQLIYGFTTSARTSDTLIRQRANRSLRHMVLRYATADAARDAAQQMADLVAAGDNRTPTALPGTSTLVVDQDFGERVAKIAITAHNTYVLYDSYSTTPEHTDLAEPVIRRSLAQQRTLIDKFLATPTKDEARAQGITGSSAPRIDANKVLVYALPLSDSELAADTGDVDGQRRRAVYGPRGLAHFSTDPYGDFTVLTDAGATVNAVERTTVYRAATPDGAENIVSAFTSANLGGGGWGPAASPPGLPNATCQASRDGTSTRWCVVAVGRYVGAASSKDEVDAHRQISAQYVILTKADQYAN